MMADFYRIYIVFDNSTDTILKSIFTLKNIVKAIYTNNVFGPIKLV